MPSGERCVVDQTIRPTARRRLRALQPHQPAPLPAVSPGADYGEDAIVRRFIGSPNPMERQRTTVPSSYETPIPWVRT